MSKINFNVTIKDLDGNEIKKGKNTINIKNVVSNALLKLQKQDNPIKVLDLALKIYNSTEAIEIDEDDVKITENAIKQGQSPVLVAGQILKILSKE